jgi:hypothetical protein
MKIARVFYSDSKFITYMFLILLLLLLLIITIVVKLIDHLQVQCYKQLIILRSYWLSHLSGIKSFLFFGLTIIFLGLPEQLGPGFSTGSMLPTPWICVMLRV